MCNSVREAHQVVGSAPLETSEMKRTHAFSAIVGQINRPRRLQCSSDFEHDFRTPRISWLRLQKGIILSAGKQLSNPEGAQVGLTRIFSASTIIRAATAATDAVQPYDNPYFRWLKVANKAEQCRMHCGCLLWCKLLQSLPSLFPWRLARGEDNLHGWLTIAVHHVAWGNHCRRQVDVQLQCFPCA